MMRRTLLSLAVASLACLPVASHAGDISYSYAEIAYVSTDIDDFDETFDGFALGGSVEVAENFFLFGSYTDQSGDFDDLDFGNVDIDVTGWTIGGGYAYPVSDTMDLVGRLAYVSTELEASAFDNSGSVDDDGYSLGAGLRAMPIKQLEIEGDITYVDLSDTGDSTTFGIAGRYYFVPQFAVGVAAGFGDDSTSYGVSARWNFGAR
jgi:Outer membrane protein beta-barrel domain